MGKKVTGSGLKMKKIGSVSLQRGGVMEGVRTNLEMTVGGHGKKSP